MSKLDAYLHQFIYDPTDQDILFDLGWEYEAKGQTAAAVSFYLRTCEFGNNLDLHYEALLRQGICFIRQGNRTWIAKGIIMRAISLAPKRPEAYFLLSELYYAGGEYQESYTSAVMGIENGTEKKETRSYLYYPGKFALVYRKALAAFKIGLFDEHKSLLQELQHDKAITPQFLELVQEHLNTTG